MNDGEQHGDLVEEAVDHAEEGNADVVVLSVHAGQLTRGRAPM